MVETLARIRSSAIIFTFFFLLVFQIVSSDGISTFPDFRSASVSWISLLRKSINFGSYRCYVPLFVWKFEPLTDPKIGMNYGRLGSALLPVEIAVKLVNSLYIRNVKTFDMDPHVIRAFSNTNISLSLCIPNEYIPFLASNPSRADSIIRKMVLPFYRQTNMSSISVGNEVSMLPEFASPLFQSMKNVYKSLRRYRLHKKIKVSTPHSLAVLAIRFPPSNAVFQESIAEPVLRPIFSFLNQTKSPFMVNLYPYLTYKEIPYIPLNFALFFEDPKVFNFTDKKTSLVYTNLFDLLVDALYSAACSLGFRNLELVVTETGWPSQGSPDGAASVQNTALFNQRLVDHISKGTPLRPGVPVMTFIFSLFDEDLKWGDPTEKHWGLFYANGTGKYDLTLTNLS